MPKITCCLSRWFGVLIGVFLELLSAVSKGRAQTVAMLNSSVRCLVFAAHTKPHVYAGLALADGPLLVGATLGKMASAHQIVVLQGRTPARWLRHATVRRVASTQS